jgi:hypothetical protein
VVENRGCGTVAANLTFVVVCEREMMDWILERAVRWVSKAVFCLEGLSFALEMMLLAMVARPQPCRRPWAHPLQLESPLLLLPHLHTLPRHSPPAVAL